MLSKKRISIVLILLFVGSSLTTVSFSSLRTNKSVELVVTFETFRYLEENYEDDALFWIDCTVDTNQYQSPKWDISQIGKPIEWEVSSVVNNSQTSCNISISLYKSTETTEVLCDLSDDESVEDHTVELFYDIKTGWWHGDDFHGDQSGYGRLNGCDDGSIYTFEDDAELFFSIFQIDEDGDFIPSWIETNMYSTDPSIDDTLSDPDEDGAGSQWEWYFGYHPNEFDDHHNLDEDGDSLSNIEEWLTRSYGSDPFRKDIFLEIDCMNASPTGESSIYPEESIELLHYPFHRRNFVVHVNRSEIVPFDEKIDNSELLSLYQTYFLHDNPSNWRRGVFHYGIYVYETTPKGYAFSGDLEPYWGYFPGTNSYVISSSRMERNARLFPQTLEYYYAAATMHEMGHNFGFRWGDPFGCDVQLGKYPWQPLYYVFGNYESIMNYRYTYKIFDYSDGSHGFLDHDDWDTLDLCYFEFQ